MTDLFLNILGRRKSKPVEEIPTNNPTIPDQTFISYIEKDLSDDLNDYVLIDANTIYPKLPPQSQNFNQQTSHSSYQYSYVRMGAGSSTTSNGSIKQEQEIITEESCSGVEVGEEPTSESSALVNRSDEYNPTSFLSGVPFQLCHNLHALQLHTNFEVHGYNYLSEKYDLLEGLSYDFSVEREVLQESESNEMLTGTY